MIYVAFHASWSDPPGDVIATFQTLEAAERFCYDEHDGYGYTVVEVPLPVGMKVMDVSALS